MSVRRPALAVALACAGALALPSAAHAYPPAPPSVQCGQTLTVDTVLRKNLTCTGDGLTLAPGVTLDLGGRTLRGSGSGVGVRVDTEGSAVVRNGTLTGWGTAMATAFDPEREHDSGPLTVDRVQFRDNGNGLDGNGEETTGRFRKPTTVTRSTFTGHTGTALDSGWNGKLTVDRSTFTDNRVAVADQGVTAITGSRFVRNEYAILGMECGIDVRDSVFVDNPHGIHTYNIGSVGVERSRFTGSQVAIGGDASVDVSATTFASNERAVVLGWMGGKVVGNTLTGNGDAVTADADWIESGLVQDNVLRGNGQGIVIVLDDASTLAVGGNDVRGSLGWGINVPGAVDLGGNTARGNGSDPQCVGVVCATSSGSTS